MDLSLSEEPNGWLYFSPPEGGLRNLMDGFIFHPLKGV
jgi:hypothetical protein